MKLQPRIPGIFSRNNLHEIIQTELNAFNRLKFKPKFIRFMYIHPFLSVKICKLKTSRLI